MELRKDIQILAQYEDLSLTEEKDNIIPEVKKSKIGDF